MNPAGKNQGASRYAPRTVKENSHMKRTSTLLLGAVVLLLSLPGSASMELNNVIFHFEPGGAAREDLEIFNPGDSPLYIEIEPKLVLSPGEPVEDRTPIVNPKQAGLLVTPNRLVIPPGATKVVRMVRLGDSPKERVYRVGAKPVIAGIEGEANGLKIMVGYEILAIVYPINPEPMVEATRVGQKMRLVNTGNTNVLLREGFQCANPKQKEEDCEPLPGKRLYPGNSWELELPYDQPVTFYQSIGTRHSIETYP